MHQSPCPSWEEGEALDPLDLAVLIHLDLKRSGRRSFAALSPLIPVGGGTPSRTSVGSRDRGPAAAEALTAPSAPILKS